MRRDELEYYLPTERIAQQPTEPRDGSRLLVLHRESGRIEHRGFRDIGEYLRAGDLLVRNDTRVIPARFFCTRATGGRIEALFLREQDGAWRVLLKPSARLRIGEALAVVGAAETLVLIERHDRGEWAARPEPAVGALELLERVGQPPLPPYIRRETLEANDVRRYQTVYARSPGAVAAPTAGLHFTPKLLERIAAMGVAAADVTLHVGLGTFSPIDAAELSEHKMHSEWYEVTREAAAAIRGAREAGGRVVAVGTTSLRVLESAALDSPAGASGWTDIFIYPPYAFRCTDALLTNFHLPGSTLLALVMAFAGVDAIRAAYAEAIEREYRFFSYGDAMLIV